MTDIDATPKARLRSLMRQLANGSVSVGPFCEAFETIYNLELDKRDLTDEEALAMGTIFDRIVWYSPFPEEREQIRNYVGEKEVEQVVQDAEQTLSQNDSE